MDFKHSHKVTSTEVWGWTPESPCGEATEAKGQGEGHKNNSGLSVTCLLLSTVEKLITSQDKVRVRNNLKFSEITRREVISSHFTSTSGQQRLFGIILIWGYRLWWQGPGDPGNDNPGLFFLLTLHCPKQLPRPWVTSRGGEMQFYHAARLREAEILVNRSSDINCQTLACKYAEVQYLFSVLTQYYVHKSCT